MKYAQSCKQMLSAILLVGSIVCSPKAFSAEVSDAPIECPEIVFSGEVQAITETSYTWVHGFMWGAIDYGSATATSLSGFAFAEEDTFDPSLFSWSFGSDGDMLLTDQLEPTSTTSGYEYYSSDPASPVTITFSYDGEPIASGTADFIRTEVDNNTDIYAIGEGQATLISPGTDTRFFDEVMAKTGGDPNG